MSGKISQRFFDLPLLRITNPNGLNDPFEFSLTEKSIIEIKEKIIGNLNKKEEFETYIGNFLSYGIISLTETHDNLLMWSHYADEHRGAAFEFDVDDNDPYGLFIFNDSMKKDNLSDAGNVKYRKTRSYEGNFSSDTLPLVRKHYVFIKSDEWIYEKEFRYAIHYSCADIVRVNIDQLNLAFDQADLDFDGFVKKNGVVKDGDDLWIDVEKSEISSELLLQMWILSGVMNSFFFKTVDFNKVSKIFLGCKERGGTMDAMEASKNDIAKQRFLLEGEFINTLKARQSKDRFELEFENHRSLFLSYIS